MYVDLTNTDWVLFFRPHALHLAGLYEGAQHYPPWVFVLLWPLAILPAAWGYFVLNGLSLVLLVGYMRASWWRVILLASTVPVIIVLVYANLDIVVSAALFLPLPVALILVACKPQVLAGWMARRLLYRWPGFVAFAPLVCVVLTSLIVWGWWPGCLSADHLVRPSISLWPWSVLPGLLLLATNSPVLWLAGSAMLSPYLHLYHLVPLLVYVYACGRPLTLVIITILSWVVTLALTA